MKERVSHMEPCLLCHTTTSSAGNGNSHLEQICDQFIEMAVQCGNHKALVDLAKHQINEIGVFSTVGACGSGTSALYKMRRLRIARKAIQAAEDSISPSASDEVRFDSNGHVI